MTDPTDLRCSCVVVALAVAALLGHTIGARRGRDGYGRALLSYAVSPIARALVTAGVSANAVTGLALVIGIAAGALAAYGHFGIAALALAFASLADGIDGMVARESRSASTAGALFDAAVDRYGEFAFIAGIAFGLRANAVILALSLGALLGSFMVSYGSAKAEAFRVAVPPGLMRRAERAVCLVAGAALTSPWDALAARYAWPAWSSHAPLLVAVAVVALVGNASAAARFQAIARAASPPPLHAAAHATRRDDEEHAPAE